LLNPKEVRSNFYVTKRNATFTSLFKALDASLGWPYDMTVNCYWGAMTLWSDDIYKKAYPNLLNYRYKKDKTFVKFDRYG